MKERILTLVVKIKDQEAAKWIWDTHISGKPENGVVVKTIYEGDEVERLEKQCEVLNLM